MTTQTQLHPQRGDSAPPVEPRGDAAPARAKAGEIRSDIGKGVGPRGNSSSSSWEFDDAAADHFANEFRPSWAPWDAASTPSAIAPQVTKPAPRFEPPPPRGFDEPITVPGRRMKRRAAVLASLSIASFLALAYWGVSSAAKQVQTTELSSIKRPPTVASGDTSSVPGDSVKTPEAGKHPQLTAAEPSATAAIEAQPPALAATAEPASTVVAQPIAPASAAAQTKDEAARAEPTSPAADTTAAQPATASAEKAAATPAPAKVPASEVAASAKPTVAPVGHPAAAAPASKATAAIAVKNEPAAVSGSAKGQPTKPSPPTAALASKPASPAPPPAPLHPRNPLLVVRALPEGSVRLWLDGQRMTNPFDIRLPRDTKHKIEARGDGYESTSQTVRLESDAKLTFALRRVAPPQRSTQTNAPAERTGNADKHRGAGFVTVSPY